MYVWEWECTITWISLVFGYVWKARILFNLVNEGLGFLLLFFKAEVPQKMSLDYLVLIIYELYCKCLEYVLVKICMS